MADDGGGYFRKKKINFSMVSNTIIRDEKISLKAKGLYALIQSYITVDDFILYKGFLQSKCLEGKKAFDGAWQELKEAGYLKQYRMQDAETKRFCWEYELLDEPEAIPPKGIVWLRDDMAKGCDGKGGGYNNTIQNNTLQNNILSNRIISTDEVMDQIGYDAFPSADKQQVMEIAMLIKDILQMPCGVKLRIAKANIPVEVVKERFMELNKFHIEYVLSCMKETKTPVGNIKNYVLTALYNAPATMGAYYQSKLRLYN